jgi:EAL domain-containing protein (putative c-di-GMP-specific phosphodiesterase class I)
VLLPRATRIRSRLAAGAEALIRWAHPERGLLPPDRFIPAAERSGLIVPLGRWVLRAACEQLGAWISAYGAAAPAVLNVNVSARELREPGFADDVLAALAEARIAPHRLAIEVTETAALEAGVSVAGLQRLRAAGVRVALDDFGTGHSTLSLLHECPVDELKLDRTFTQAPPDGRPSVAVAVFEVARALRVDVVAEGIETAHQAARLRALGYETGQGFLFGGPMPADELAAHFEAARPVSAGSSAAAGTADVS